MSETIKCPGCGKTNRFEKKEGAVCGHCHLPLFDESNPVPATVDEKSFPAFINSDSPALVDFWAPWCGPCRMLTPVLEKFAAKQQLIRVGKVNVDENQQIAASFQIMSIPTMILFQGGIEKKRLMGLKSLSELESDLAEWL